MSCICNYIVSKIKKMTRFIVYYMFVCECEDYVESHDKNKDHPILSCVTRMTIIVRVYVQLHVHVDMNHCVYSLTWP